MAPSVLQVAVFGARLLARLSVVGAVARLQETAEELARMHALNASPDSAATQVLVACCCSYATPASLKSLRTWWHCLSQPWLSCRRGLTPLACTACRRRSKRWPPASLLWRTACLPLVRLQCSLSTPSCLPCMARVGFVYPDTHCCRAPCYTACLS